MPEIINPITDPIKYELSKYRYVFLLGQVLIYFSLFMAIFTPCSIKYELSKLYNCD